MNIGDVSTLIGMYSKDFKKSDWAEDEKNEFNQEIESSFIKSPLFVHRVTSNHIQETWLQENPKIKEICSSKLTVRMPFNFVKLLINFQDLISGDKSEIFLLAMNNKDSILLFGHWSIMPSHTWFNAKVIDGINDDEIGCSCFIIADNGKTVRIDDYFSNVKDRSEHARFMQNVFLYKMFATFCYDFFTSSNHIVKSTPDRKNKSIEWKESRVHYTLIHKSQSPAFCSHKLKSDQENIKRMAHSRRAHFRLLSSPKYKNKMGQRVFVRSAWIGPKEWKDKESGQIYMIADDHFKQEAA